jgi:CubicO group peptidase (beta-lactamase class C family)
MAASELAKIPPLLQGAVGTGALSGVVTLLYRRGEVAQVNAVGKRSVERDLPMTRDTLFRIASMTKPVTTVAALMLVEEGKLKLDDPIAKWAPEFAEMRVIDDPAGPLDATSAAARPITIEDLMTHRSGIAYGFTSTGPLEAAHRDKLGDPLASNADPDAWLKALASIPLSYQPGARFHYGHSTDVLGFIVGRIDGVAFRDSLMKRIFGPLGMTDTDFWVPQDKRDRAASLYTFDNATEKLRLLPALPYEAPPKFAAGGGGLVSKADDYLKFARLLLNGGEVDGVRLLRKESVDLMRANRLTPAQREIPFLGMDFWWQAQGFGLGLSMITDPDKHIIGVGRRGAYGWPGIFGTWWQADPTEDMILMYLIQNSAVLDGGGVGAAVAGQAMTARMAQPMFQRIAYDALSAAG